VGVPEPGTQFQNRKNCGLGGGGGGGGRSPVSTHNLPKNCCLLLRVQEFEVPDIVEFQPMRIGCQ
jgi:hypothetical protein